MVIDIGIWFCLLFLYLEWCWVWWVRNPWFPMEISVIESVRRCSAQCLQFLWVIRYSFDVIFCTWELYCRFLDVALLVFLVIFRLIRIVRNKLGFYVRRLNLAMRLFWGRRARINCRACWSRMSLAWLVREAWCREGTFKEIVNVEYELYFWRITICHRSYWTFMACG